LIKTFGISAKYQAIKRFFLIINFRFRRHHTPMEMMAQQTKCIRKSGPKNLRNLGAAHVQRIYGWQYIPFEYVPNDHKIKGTYGFHE
jgi:hypothetical protein